MSFNTIKVNSTDTNYTHSIFDISEYNSGAIYANLSAALAAVPQNKQQGGMTVKFIQQVTLTRYSVVKTENLETQPTGTLLSEAPYIDSGTYDESQLSTIFSTLPSETGFENALTYYVAVTVDETTTYTSWVITKVQNSDNKYLQYRLMSDTFSTTENNWQGVDAKPKLVSKNLVESGGVADKLLEYENYFNDTKPSVCVDDSDADFNIVDVIGYVLAEFKGGHIKTRNFDSRNILTMLNKYTRFSYTQEDGIFIADEYGYVLFSLDDYLSEIIPGNGGVIKKKTIQDGLFISDEFGNAYVDFSKGIKTKYFDGRALYPGTINKNTSTLTGCINKAYDMIHTKWPMAQVFVCSIMKHGRTMADANKSYLSFNSAGLFKNQLNKRIKECAELAGFYYIDLWGEMGIDPLNATQAEIFFHNAQEIADRGVDPARINDKLHPIQAGHERIAKVIYNHLVSANGGDSWQGKKAIFFGDSITDNVNGMHTDKVYYSYLTDWLHLRDDGMNPNGYSTKNTVHYPQNAGAAGTGYMLEYGGQGNLYQRIPDYNDDYDLVVILLGVNDFNQPLGEIYNY